MGNGIDDAPSLLQEWSDYLSLWICENNSSCFHLYNMRRHSFFRLYSRWVAERSRALLRQNFNLRKRQVSLILFPFLVNDLQCHSRGSISFSLLLQGKEIIEARLFGWSSTDCNAWGNKISETRLGELAATCSWTMRLLGPDPELLLSL